MTALSLKAKRIVLGIALAGCLLCLANYWFGFGFFGEWDRKVMVVSFAVLAVALYVFGPTVQEIERHRESKRNSSWGKRCSYLEAP